MRLYLVLSVIFFLVATSGGGRIEMVGVESADNGGTSVVVSSLNSTAQPGESLAQRQARVCGRVEYHWWWSERLQPAMRKACMQYLADNGGSVREAFYHALPRAMFLFLPLLAVVMKLLYRRPRHYYVEHLLLLVHNHAFVFLLVTLSWLVQRALPASSPADIAISLLQLAVQIYLALYVYWSMRRVYGQGRLLTVAKFLVMSGAYIVSAGLMVLLTGVYTTLSL